MITATVTTAMGVTRASSTRNLRVRIGGWAKLPVVSTFENSPGCPHHSGLGDVHPFDSPLR